MITSFTHRAQTMLGKSVSVLAALAMVLSPFAGALPMVPAVSVAEASTYSGYIETQAATNITQISATLNGNSYTSMRGRGFEYGLDTTYGSSTYEGELGTEGIGIPAESFSHDVNNLTCGTTYHYRILVLPGGAVDDSSMIHGDDRTFTTEACDVPDPVDISDPVQKSADAGETIDITDLEITGGSNTDEVDMTLYVRAGSLAFGSRTGLTFNGVNEGNNLKFRGTIGAINNALETLTYTAPYIGGTYEIEALIDEADGSVYRHSNGHVYKVVTVGGDGITWTEARAAAQVYKFPGETSELSGYLATIVDEDEHNFVRARIDEDGWFGASDDTDVTGGYDGSGEGEWFWVTGPEAGTKFWTGGRDGSIVPGQYANWNKVGSANEPNNSTSANFPDGEHCAQIRFSVAGAEGKWNDLPCEAKLPKYVVEFGTNDENNKPAVKRSTFNVEVAAPVQEGTEQRPYIIEQCFTAEEPGVYRLAQNITGVPGDCIIIESSDVVIDGNGLSISGTVDNDGDAIRSHTFSHFSRENIEIRNITITSFEQGIYTRQNSNVLIDDVTISNSDYGIWIEGEWGEGVVIYEGATITNSTLTNNGSGIVIHAMRDVEISDNEISVGQKGIVVETGSENVTIEDNTITAAESVIEVDGIVSVLIKNNTLRGTEDEPVLRIGTVWWDATPSYIILGNEIRGERWVSVDAGVTSGLVFSRAGIGNLYRFANGDGAWEEFDIIDEDDNGYADLGEDRPFMDDLTHEGVVLWSGPGADYSPATILTPSGQIVDDVLTLAADEEVLQTSRKLYGSVNDKLFQLHARWFEYGTTTDYGQVVDDEPSEGYPLGTFNLTATGLTCGTTYHFRAGATINDGGTYDAFGEDRTFTTAACSGGNGGGNNGGGSSGGSSGGSRRPAATTTTTPTTQPTVAALQTQLAQLQAQLAVLLANAGTPTTPAPTGTCSPFTFTRDLQFGNEGEDVRALQRFLNCQGFSLGTTGPGSAGQETQYFVERTRDAVIKFQETYATEILAPINRTTGTGIFSSYSRAKAHGLMAQ